eukprot:CAMPEP_0168473146 /NCGR_PEP_ID=MMETSP0228-20121227/60171_1 /TAXON_ID=133427 /ORGANISM="Protoceratium reticulatum, Strain CCCM 535 (=CCMP 1889)" /LENGTH=57 /DNA_ID=CAMNT_0008489125 /DNA_START=89 /DNA_END=259 /DNA_ORIENTATION=-
MEMLTKASPQACWAASTSFSVILDRGLPLKKVKVQVVSTTAEISNKDPKHAILVERM